MGGLSMFALMQSTRTQSLHLFNDPPTGLKAVVAIHSEQLGPAMGGCRYLPYADDESAMTDAIRLAQGMSYKAALAGLPLGGGKAVITRNPHVENRAALFEAFGRFIDTLHGRFIIAVDSGTSTLDMDCIAQSTPHVTSTTASGDPSPHAAMGVFAGIRATTSFRLGSDDLRGLRVAVQGLGNVGFALAEQLHAVGAELLVSDLDPGRVRLAMEQFDAKPVTNDALISTPCDIFAPCGAVSYTHLVSALARIKSYHDYGTFTPLQVAAIAALEGDQQCVRDIAEQYRQRRNLLVKGLHELGWMVENPKASMYVWAKIPEQYAHLGSLEFSKKLLAEAKVCVSPGIGFGDYGDDHVRFALIENQDRIRQAIRGIRQMFRADGLARK